MKKLILATIILFTMMFLTSKVFAQGMGNRTSSPSSVTSDDHTAREEQEGKEIWEKFQAKQIECKDFTNDNYAVLGEYFMGQSIGDTQRHAAMNLMMTSMMGEEGEEQMHIALGKRSSGCDTNASFPSGYGMPMMWMMGSAFAPWSFGGTKGGGNPMMGYGGSGNMMGWGFGILGWIFMLIFWVILILGVIALVRYLKGSERRDNEGKSPLDILKERYARGEIEKKEFEEKKKDLS